MAKRPATKGEKLIGVFNNTQNPKIVQIKKQAAALVDLMDETHKEMGSKDFRQLALFDTNIQQAIMWGVGSLFENPSEIEE